MASFYAELRVDGHVFPLLSCEHSRYQATDPRGRPGPLVHHSPVEMTLNTPQGVLLCAWAADETKRLAAEVVYLDADGGGVLLTVSLAAAYCIGYHEHFYASPGQGGPSSYTCYVALVDPDGFTLTPGSARAYVAPAARDHGVPPVAAVLPSGPTIPISTTEGKRKRIAKPKFVAGSNEHKAARWATYQVKNKDNAKAWSYPTWEKQYHVNMRNASFGLAREQQYRDSLGGESKTLKTPLTFRQIDIFRKDEDYCGQLKTGKMSLNKQARTEDIPKDAELVRVGFQVEYILEKGATKPFLKALDAAGVTYKTSPQIP